MDISKLMGQMKKLQEAQEDIAEMTAEAKDPSGKITAVGTGAGTLASLSLDPSVISADDADFLADLILKTCNQALTDAKEKAAKEVAGNLNLPGLG